MAEWKIQVPSELTVDLIDSLRRGEIAEWRESGNHLYYIEKVQVDRFDGFKVEIFSNEHPPPHFRVSYQGDSVDFAISDCRVISGGQGKTRKIIKNVQKEYWPKNKQRLIDFWDVRRPTDCPVGKFR